MITNVLLILNLIFLVVIVLFISLCMIRIGHINKWRGSINKELDLVFERFDLNRKHFNLISKRLDAQDNHNSIIHNLVVKLAEQNGDDDADYWKHN